MNIEFQFLKYRFVLPSASPLVRLPKKAQTHYASELSRATLLLVEIAFIQLRSAMPRSQSLRRKRRALPITEAELKLMASAAIIGDNNQPVNGYNTPAATGIPSAL